MIGAHSDLAGNVPPFQWGAVFTVWDFHLAPTLGAGLAVLGYALGVIKLARRGDQWPPLRILAFVLAIVLWLFATASGLAAYDTLVIRAHMIQHMLLSMLVPLALALSAPVTLALRTLPLRGRNVLLAVLHSRLAKVLTFPPLTLAVYVASPWVLYFTGWYGASLRSAYVHEMMHLHLIVVGSMFFWPLVGVDPIPGRVSYPMRLIMIVLTLPFHAFLGVTLMSQQAVIGNGWYESLAQLEQTAWIGDPWADQHRAGGLLWMAGDLVGLIVGVVLFVQWARSSMREAAREDRRLDLEANRSG